MKPHVHRAIPGKDSERCWTYCVAEDVCIGAAHGGIVREDACACGATRLTEINGGRKKRGPWHMPHPVFHAGDRVSAGEGRDYDEGKIETIVGATAYVAWQSGVKTRTPLEDLQPLAK